MSADKTNQPAAPWWRHGHVWLLISGPAVVVVAALFTAWLAARGSDALVEEDYYRKGIEINKQLARERAMLPALQGRNHAVTPVTPAAPVQGQPQ